jgi:hypothetical protein
MPSAITASSPPIAAADGRGVQPILQVQVLDVLALHEGLLGAGHSENISTEMA